MFTILVVEDDHNLGLMIKDILEFEEYNVILSKKPLLTQNNLKNNRVDLVLLDKLISGIDGTNVCKEIRADQETANVPVLMMSALQDVHNICIAAGATDFISKPFEMDLFLRKINSLIVSAQQTNRSS